MESLKRLLSGGALAAVWLLACSFCPLVVLPAEAVNIAAPPSPADLAVTALTVSPETPSAGETVTISVTVQNIGESAAPECTLAYFIDEKQVGTSLIDTLGANARTDLSINWKAQGGSHVLRAVADIDHQLNEPNRDNNSKSLAFSVKAPDLVITSISWTPTNPAMGNNVTFTVNVANQGNARSGSCQLDFSINGASRGYRTLFVLEPGATASEIYTWYVTAGNHTIAATVDVLQGISETDDTNNRMEATLVTALPDLIISAIALQSTNTTMQTLTFGDNIDINVFVKNRGTGRAAPTQVICYIDETPLGAGWIGFLNPEESANWTFSWMVDDNLHTIKAIADATKAILESDETNNEKTIPAPSVLPDLLISDITWDPSALIVNQPATFVITVKNQGKTKSPPTELKYGFDTVYQFTTYIPELEINQSSTTTIMFTPVYPSFTVNAAIDIENKIKESSKSNNSLTKNVSATKPVASADLAVVSLTLTPARPLRGQTAILTLVTKNKGSGAAGASFTAVYLEDAQITTIYIDSIAAGATDSKNVLISLKDVPDKSAYSVRVKLNCTSIVPETDEFNNNAELLFSLSSPVLGVEGITWAPLIPNQGDVVTFEITAANNGAATSPSTRISYYIDNTYAGQHLLDPIAPGGKLTRQFTWKAQSIPFTFTATIEEVNSSKSATIPAPDLLIDSITWQPDAPKEMDMVAFTVTISNRGKGPAAATLLYCYTDNGTPMTVNTPEIAPGNNTNVSFLNAFISGERTIKFVPNGDGTVIEANASNNDKTVKLTVQPLATTKPAATTSTPAKTTAAPTQTPTQSTKTTAVKPSATPTGSAGEEDAAPAWQSILMNKWIMVCVALVGIGLIGLLLLSRKKAAKSGGKPAKPAKSAAPAKPAEPAKPAGKTPEKK